MPSNERVNKRKEKKRKRDKKIKVALYVSLTIIAALLLILKACEIDFKGLKENIVSGASVSESYPFSVDLFQEGRLDVVNDKLAVITDNSLTVLEPASAKVLYTFDHGYVNPFVEHAGDFMLMYDQSGTRLRLDSTKKDYYEKSLDKSIITAALSKNGVVAYATLSDEAKSKLVVQNSNEIVKMELDIKDGYVTQIALNPSGTKLAYTTVNTVDSFLQTTVHTISVGDKKDTRSFDLTGVNVLDLHYSSSNDFYIIGDNMVSIVKGQKSLKEVLKQGNTVVNRYVYTQNNELVLNYAEYANATKSKLAYIKSNGKISNSFDINGDIKYLSTYSNEISALYQDKIIVYSLSHDKIKDTIPCDNSVASIHRLASKNYVLKGQSIDIIE